MLPDEPPSLPPGPPPLRRWIRVSIPSFSVEVIGDGRTVFAMSGVAVLIPEVVSPSADDVARHGPLPARLDSTGPAVA